MSGTLADQDGLATATRVGERPERVLPGHVVSWLQAAPLAVVLVGLVLVPIVLMLVVSFLDYGYAQVFPVINLDSYRDILTSRLTLDLYVTTFRFVAIVWAATFVIGFAVSYFVIFHVRTRSAQALCILACAIPFWTSGPIRMISWVPFLGREGLVNKLLIGIGYTSQPLEWLLYSPFSVCLVYINTLTLAMIGPIANSMAKIDQGIIQAARDQGASEWQIVKWIVAPLAKPGVAIGTIFVVTAVMGDFFVVKQMSGSQVNTAVGAIATELDAFQYPPAAAKSMIMLVVVLAIVGAVMRVVDIRRELAR